MILTQLFGCWRRLVEDERGACGIEASLCVPLVSVLFMTLGDARELYHKHAMMWEAGRDAARALARKVATPSEAEDRIRLALADFASGVDVSIEEVPMVVVTITADFDRESLFGVLGPFYGVSRPARVVMRPEPAIW